MAIQSGVIIMATIKEILTKLRQPIDRNLISSKSIKGNKIDYVAWFNYCNILDNLCFWEWEIISITTTETQLFMTAKLTIHGDDRSLSMMASGTESLSCSSYGDSSSNAESMCLRRCLAKFGCSRELWKKDKPPQPMKTIPSHSHSAKEISREEWLKRKAPPN